MNNSFYNTINLAGEDLQEANADAKKYEELLAAIFRANPGLKLSPSQVHTITTDKFKRKCPITSTRRGMTNLSNKELHDPPILVKLGKADQIPGPLGMPEYCWQFNGPELQIQAPEHYKKEVMTAADFASVLINRSTKQGKFF